MPGSRVRVPPLLSGKACGPYGRCALSFSGALRHDTAAWAAFAAAEPPQRSRRMQRAPRYIWLRHGDHRVAIERAIAVCASEHGGEARGQPTVIAHRDADGHVFTGLEAAGSWWLEYMRVHGHEWTGPISRDQASDILDRD